MQPFTFDVSTLSPATGIGLGSLANARPRERFGDHFGQATYSPRPAAPEPAASPESRSASDRPGNASESKSEVTGDATDQNQSQTGEEHDEDRNGGGASAHDAATVPPAERLVNRPKLPDGRQETTPSDTNALRAAGKSAKSKGKAVQARLSPDGDPTALQESGKPPLNQAAGKLITDSTPVGEPPEPVAGDKSRAATEKIVIDLGASAAPNVDSNANNVATIIASGANQPNASTATSAIGDATDVTSVGAVQAANPEKAEPSNAAKRGRSAKAGAISEATGAPNETALLSLEPDSVTDDAQANAVAELAATLDASGAEDTAGGDAISSRDNAEPRSGAVPTLLASRQERLHESSSRSEGLTDAERVRFVQRVARAFHSMGDEGGEVRLRLSPPELGSLRLEVSVRDGVMSARLETETASARNLLLDNLPALRERLAEQSIKVERFEVNVRDEQRQPSRENLPGQPDVPQQGQRDRPRGQDSRKTTSVVQAVPRGAVRIDKTSELNIVI